MSQDALRRDNSGGDAIDAIVEQWNRERPDLDPSAKHVTGRLIRLSGIFQAIQRDAYQRFGINETDFGILAPLRRSGAPFTLTPTDLARTQMMTSGGMTAAIDRVERKGLVERVPNPADRRGNLVRLTDEGRRVIDAAMELHCDLEHQMVAALTPRQREQLAGLLRTLVLALD